MEQNEFEVVVKQYQQWLADAQFALAVANAKLDTLGRKEESPKPKDPNG